MALPKPKWDVRVWWIEFDLRHFDFSFSSSENKITAQAIYHLLEGSQERKNAYPIFFERAKTKNNQISLHRKDTNEDVDVTKKTTIILDSQKYPPQDHVIYFRTLTCRMNFRMHNRFSPMLDSGLPAFFEWDETVMAMKRRLLRDGALSAIKNLHFEQTWEQLHQTVDHVPYLKDFMKTLPEADRNAALRNQFPESLYTIYGYRVSEPNLPIILLPTQKISETLFALAQVNNEEIRFVVLFGKDVQRDPAQTPLDMPEDWMQMGEPLGRKRHANKTQT